LDEAMSVPEPFFVPLVSVYIPNHNYGRYIEQAIESVLTQTLSNIELIIIDDGSIDDSREIISRFADRQNTNVIFQKNHGLNVTNNIAIRASRGKYIIRLDADDYFDPHALQIMSELLEREPDVGMVFPDYYHVDKGGQVIDTVRRHDFDEVSLLDQPAHGAGTMIRRECLLELNGYDEQFQCQDGYELWIRFVKHYQVKNIQLPLFYYRQHDKSLTNNEERILQTRHEILARERLRRESPLTIVGVIPVRGNKIDNNTSPLSKLGGKPLIDWTIEAALKSARIDFLILSTPSSEILEYVRHRHGDSVFRVLRTPELARPNTPIEETVLEALDGIKSFNRPDAVATLAVEFPFRSAQQIDMAADVMEIFDVDSVIAVRAEQEELFQHTGHGLSPIRTTRKLRLERDEIFRETGGLHLTKRTLLEKENMIVGGRVGHVIIDKRAALGVHSYFDWTLAEASLSLGQLNPSGRTT
jgi:glycosyltransferase involved in cell wall biosynthesis